MKIKICGLASLADVALINRYKPDFAGFVFAESKRQVRPDQAKALIEALDHSVKAAGVFVNVNVSQVADIARYCGLTVIQLHGDEDKEYVRQLKKRLPYITVIKAVAVKDYEGMTEALSLGADLLLFDAYDKNTRGGTGRIADWTFIKRFGEEMAQPFLLAGGLRPENVKDAMEIRPWGIDLSSGVEKEQGGKDPAKMAALFKEIREI